MEQPRQPIPNLLQCLTSYLTLWDATFTSPKDKPPFQTSWAQSPFQASQARSLFQTSQAWCRFQTSQTLSRFQTSRQDLRLWVEWYLNQ